MPTMSSILTWCLAVTAFAQEAPQMARLYHFQIPPDSAAEFFSVQRETAEIYKANKAPIQRLGWTSLTGPLTFHMFVPLENLAQLGEPTWLSKQGEEQARGARQMRLRRASGDSTIEVITANADLTWDPTPDAPPDAYLLLTTYSVKPGKVADFLAMMKDLNEVTKKMGKAKSIFVHRVAFGGDGYLFYVATGYASLVDVAPPSEFRKAMGEAAYTAYVQKQGSIINSIRREILRYRPEFSYVPSK